MRKAHGLQVEMEVGMSRMTGGGGLVLRRTDARDRRVFSRLWIVRSWRQWNEGSKTGGIAGSGCCWGWGETEAQIRMWMTFAFALTTRALLMLLALLWRGKRDGSTNGGNDVVAFQPPNGWLLPCSNHVDQAWRLHYTRLASESLANISFTTSTSGTPVHACLIHSMIE